jgi:hypothetical protein
MATEYDLLRLLVSRQDKHNQRTATPIDERINITATPIDKRINITGLLLSLLRTRPSWARGRLAVLETIGVRVRVFGVDRDMTPNLVAN